MRELARYVHHNIRRHLDRVSWLHSLELRWLLGEVRRLRYV
jgi:hypothetical protein